MVNLGVIAKIIVANAIAKCKGILLWCVCGCIRDAYLP
jgi:hypothetical protein